MTMLLHGFYFTPLIHWTNSKKCSFFFTIYTYIYIVGTFFSCVRPHCASASYEVPGEIQGDPAFDDGPSAGVRGKKTSYIMVFSVHVFLWEAHLWSIWYPYTHSYGWGISLAHTDLSIIHKWWYNKKNGMIQMACLFALELYT